MAAPNVFGITVTIHFGTDLAPMDVNGLSDPYCQCNWGTETKKTSIKEKTLNPQWEETCTFAHIIH